MSAPSVDRWRALERTQGDAAPRPVGGDHRSHRTEAHAAAIFSALKPPPDLTLEELREKLAQEKVSRELWGALAVSRSPQDHAQKKTAHPSEQDRPDIVKRREDGFEDNSISTRNVSSLSTRLGPRPTNMARR